MPFREIAQRLDLNEVTIRTRIRRLEQSGVMRVIARVDLTALGYPFTALLGLKIRGRTIDEVCAQMVDWPEILSILVVIGRSDLEVQVKASSMEALQELIHERIAGIDGVVGIESALAMRINKYVQPWGQFR